MVTKIIVRIPLEIEGRGRGRASASNSNRGGDVRNSKQGDEDDNADDSKEADEEGNQLRSFKTCQRKAVAVAVDGNGGICAGHSSYHDVFFNDNTTEDGKAVDIPPHDNSKKRPRALEDAGDTKKKKRQPSSARVVFKHRARAGNSGRERRNRLRLIDLSDVPAQPLILKSSGKDGTSKYQGVQFNKARDTWQATIVIDGAHHFIGYYDSEEEAAVDYARAVFKYHAKPLPPLIHPYAPTDLKEMEERQRRALAYSMMSDEDREKVRLQWNQGYVYT